jgi:glutamate synthase domain-containing protein 3
MAYVYDPENLGPRRYNDGMIRIERMSDEDEIKAVQALIYQHLERTESLRANHILKSWKDALPHFWRVVPRPAEAKPASKPVHELEDEKAKPTPAGGF